MNSSIAVRQLCCLLLATGAAFTCRAQPAANLYAFSQVPAWVALAKAQYDAPLPSDGLSRGAWHLMIDRQVNVGARGDEYYEHSAIRILNAEGLDAESQIELNIDPSYQTLAIHTLQLVRAGRVIDQRKLARITALPNETDAEKHVFNGGYAVNLLLSNVRVGDVIEYSYTVISVDHLFPGNYARRFTVGWSVPELWQRLRVVYPVSRPLQYRFNVAGEPVPSVRDRGPLRELTFLWQQLAGIPAQSDRPSWYSMWPFLDVSDYADWSQVAARMVPLYRLDGRARPQLDALIASIKSRGGAPEQQALLALQHVQDDIRYTSISIGRGSFAPSDPEVVLGRRFGDCKDKSLLLVTILRRLGIDATAALVHSRRGHTLPQALPSAYAFDHVIVRAGIGAAVYWLDATEAKQYSALPRLEPADFEYALAIGPEQRALQAIPRPAPDARAREVEATLDLRNGLLKPAQFEVITRYRNASADYIRADLSRTSDAERQSNYVNYYARLYPGIRAAKAMSVTDDTVNDVLVTRESYLIDKVASEDGDGKLTVVLHSDEMYRYGDPIDSSVRTVPLELDYPVNVRQTVTALLPESWPVKDELVKVDNAAFHYQSTISHSDRAITLSYAYQALADHVDVAALPRYVIDRKKLNDDMDYRFWRNINAAAPAGFSIAPAPVAVGLVSLLLSVWVMIGVVYRYDPPARPAAPGARSGIAGWLLVPALSAALDPLIFVYLIAQLLRYVDASMWAVLPTIVAASYRSWAQPALLLLLSSGAAIFCFTCTVAVLFFRRRSSAPVLFVVMLCAIVGYSCVIDAALANSGIKTVGTNLHAVTDLIRGVITIAIWSAYMRRSARVKATFVNRLERAGAALAPVQSPVAPQAAE
jgi:transglutaminase-like putative cysteine protease